MVENVLYTSTQTEKIDALNPETGKEIWKFDPKANGRENRGVSYWPGDQKTPARILLGTGDGRLIALDAQTGLPAPSFGDHGVVNLPSGMTPQVPAAAVGTTPPPAIHPALGSVCPSTQG